jgi:non-ribosomal peptide synthetase component F
MIQFSEMVSCFLMSNCISIVLIREPKIVFTPLFLGAQLLVPARSDIAHERLAEWMAKHSPTVTHLTPASMSK